MRLLKFIGRKILEKWGPDLLPPKMKTDDKVWVHCGGKKIPGIIKCANYLRIGTHMVETENNILYLSEWMGSLHILTQRE